MNHELSDKSSLKRYRTEVPNIVFHLNLSPYELALYVHIKRAAGGGQGGRCTKSGRKLANEAGMSHPMMLKAKATLAQPFETLNGKPLIVLTDPEPGKRQSVEIVDIWDDNSAYMLNLKSGQPYDHSHQKAVNDVTKVVNPVTTSGKPHDQSGQPGDRHLKKEPKNEPTEERTKEPALVVFDFYREHMNHPKSVLTDERRKLIARRLKEGYSADDMCTAIRGCKLSEFHQGKNESGTVYDSIEIVLRSAKHIEGFIARAEIGANGNGTKPKTTSERNVANLRAGLALFQGQSRPDDSQEPFGLLPTNAGTGGTGADG